jgi:anti-sigma regulatory factor (Ser/Thr protein kinase)
MAAQKVFKADLEQLYKMLDYIQDYGVSERIPQSTLNQMILAAEEAIVNIIEYGYPEENKGEIEINCETLISEKSGVRIKLRDHGVPFNPIENISDILPILPGLKNETDVSSGGYGIFILRELMDKVEYHRVNEWNVLYLTKYYSA